MTRNEAVTWLLSAFFMFQFYGAMAGAVVVVMSEKIFGEKAISAF